MKSVLVTAAALSMTATSVFANTVEVVRDGVVYNCETAIITKDGQRSQRCVVADTGGTLFGGGLGVGTYVLLGLGTAAVIAVLSNSDDDENNATNGTN